VSFPFFAARAMAGVLKPGVGMCYFFLCPIASKLKKAEYKPPPQKGLTDA
jgi:hypothetical protein